jgi:hypothetical protein
MYAVDSTDNVVYNILGVSLLAEKESATQRTTIKYIVINIK